MLGEAAPAFAVPGLDRPVEAALGVGPVDLAGEAGRHPGLESDHPWVDIRALGHAPLRALAIRGERLELEGTVIAGAEVRHLLVRALPELPRGLEPDVLLAQSARERASAFDGSRGRFGPGRPAAQ